MIFKAQGLIEFEDGLKLKDPSMEIKWVNYNFEDNKFDLVLSFYETHFKHVRTFYNDTTIIGLVKTEDVINFISNDAFLSQFIIQP